MATKKMLPTTTYRDVLKRAFVAVKKYRFLWFFGFFAAFLGAAGELEPLFKNYSDIASRSQGILDLKTYYEGGVIASFYETTRLFFLAYPWQAFFLLTMISIVAVIFLWLAIVSQIALFDSAKKIEKKQAVSYGDAYRVGNRYFGTVLLINIIVRVILYGFFIAVGLPLVSWFLLRGSILGGVLFIILIFLVYIPVNIIVSFIVKYTVAYIVVQQKKLGDAVKLAIALFKKNWLVSIEMAFLVVAIGIGVGVLMVIMLAITAIPFLLIGGASLVFGSSTGFSAAVVIGTIVWFIVIAVIGSAFVAFQYTAWTFLFLKLDGNTAESKLKRWFVQLKTAKK